MHKPGSTSEVRTDTSSASNLNALQTFELQDSKLVEAGVAFEKSVGGREAGAVAGLGHLLYGLENLRKREGDGGEE